MELGEKLRLARQEAGLSQRQLAGDDITRNMLSQIEHGTAQPSMKTLRILAQRLGKPVSFFLEETALTSPNQGVMASARRLWDAGEDAQALLVLEGYQGPDPVFDREKGLLQALLRLRLAEAAIQEGRGPYAQSLLEATETEGLYCAQDLERRRLLLLGTLRGQQVSDRLPSLDEELLLRATEALDAGDAVRAAQLLDAAEDQGVPRWNFLRGQAYLRQKQYQEAAACLQKAEGEFPQAVASLEVCFRELGDYKMAYEYAKKQR